ncbi:hypothetical protein [Candidatus Pristimantibacillus sp. PTI5]|uniref:hypothetical protein n=1 Tax=Candidatus Pristimantibacillus sp. PTI5 TaxID=3400422 RepID=UPI003B011D6E
MLVHYYIAEKLWEERERDWELRVRRGEFMKAEQPKPSFIRRLLSRRRLAYTPMEDSHDGCEPR